MLRILKKCCKISGQVLKTLLRWPSSCAWFNIFDDRFLQAKSMPHTNKKCVRFMHAVKCIFCGRPSVPFPPLTWPLSSEFATMKEFFYDHSQSKTNSIPCWAHTQPSSMIPCAFDEYTWVFFILFNWHNRIWNDRDYINELRNEWNRCDDCRTKTSNDALKGHRRI